MADGFTSTKANPLFGVSMRQRPSNLSAEMALIGSILANNRAFEKVADYLTPALFADSVNGRIYQRIAELLLDGRLCDPVSLKNSFENSGILDEVGGTAYLSLLLSRMVSLNTAAEYGLAIRDAWVRRQLIDLGENVVARAFGGEPACDAQKQVELLETALAELRGQAGHSDWVGTVGDTVDAEINAYDARSSGRDGQFLTGWPTLDDALFIAPGSFTLLGGLPGSGKTSMSIGMGLERARALHATAIAGGWSPERSKRQAGVAFLSLEMDRQALAQRIIAYEAKVPLRELIRGKLNDIEIERVRQAQGRLRYLPLRIWEGRGMPLRILAPKLRMHLARQPEVCVMVDNLSLTTSDNDGSSNSRFQSDVTEIKAATRGFKQLANEIRLPFIVLAHIARPTKNMAVRRPRKEDLAYAGERDADNVVFIHRPEMHLRDKPDQGKYEKDEHYSSVTLVRWENECSRAKDVAEIVVAKQRQGEERVVRLRWTGATTSLSEFDAPAPVQEAMPGWVME